MKKMLLLTALVGLGIPMSSFANETSKNDSIGDYIKANPQIIKDVLVKHPEYLLDAEKALEVKHRTDSLLAYVNSITLSREYSTQLSMINSGYMGNKNGKTILVEFFDYQCHFCKQTEPEINNLLAINKDILFIPKEVAFISKDSVYASLVSIASSKIDHDLYLKIHRDLINSSSPLTHDKVDEIIHKNTVKYDQIQDIIKTGEPQKILDSNAQLMQNLKSYGTPAFVVPGKGILQGFSPTSKLITYLETPNPTQEEITSLLKGK
jgi:protein-disulfide isomerase